MGDKKKIEKVSRRCRVVSSCVEVTGRGGSVYRLPVVAGGGHGTVQDLSQLYIVSPVVAPVSILMV